jgi:phenylacetate-CoA oxygenase PaaI subunit
MSNQPWPPAATSDPNDFSLKTQTFLANLLLQLADNKYVLGKRYAEWSNSAPLLEAAVAAAAMTQDELGHARSLYPLLRDFPQANPALNREVERTDLNSATFLDEPFAHWTDFVAAVFLFDQALSVIFAAAHESAYEPLRQRAEKIWQEERFHAMYGVTWLRSLSIEGTIARRALADALQRIWPEVICWLGRPDEPEQQQALAEGLLADDVETLRQKFLQQVGPLLLELGYDLPFDYDETARCWRLTDPLPWHRWQAGRRRLELG